MKGIIRQDTTETNLVILSYYAFLPLSYAANELAFGGMLHKQNKLVSAAHPASGLIQISNVLRGTTIAFICLLIVSISKTL